MCLSIRLSQVHGHVHVHAYRRVAARNSLKNEKRWSDCRLTGKAVNRAQAHPAATVPTTGHATTILHTLELPSWSPRGSGATQTSTSTSACCTRTERSTSDEAFSRHTSCFSMKQAASNWPASRTTWSNQLQLVAPSENDHQLPLLCSCEHEASLGQWPHAAAMSRAMRRRQLLQLQQQPQRRHRG